MFGCSECLCIAIESHRPALLKSLLRQPDVRFRDLFWAPTPTTWLWTSDDRLSSGRVAFQYPQLHGVDERTDLSFIGSEDCGHMKADVELLSPLPLETTAYILVSLPLLARWHSTEGFNAERILKRSGKFDYSEPQLFHLKYLSRDTFHLSISDSWPGGPLTICEDDEIRLFCEFECPCESFSVRLHPATAPLVLHQKSTLTCESTFVSCEFSKENNFSFKKYYGMLSRLFNGLNDFQSNDIYYSSFRDQLANIVHKGADLNSLSLASTVYIVSNRMNRELNCANGFDYLLQLCNLIYWSCDLVLRDFDEFIRFLLTNGLAYFHRGPHTVEEHFTDSFLKCLIKCSGDDEQLAFFTGIAYQLLALGFGRRELHPNGFPVCDEHLNATRKAIARIRTDYQNEHMPGANPAAFPTTFEEDLQVADELEAIVNSFDAGPLPLLQLSRIAIRRAVGGRHFVSKMKLLATRMRPLHFKYVADPTDLMVPYNNSDE